ncbi:hypothetical protein [Eoetvoesiella caeni]
MREELLTPAAILTQSILKSVEKQHNEFTTDIVASAFLDAYRAIEIAEQQHLKEGPKSVYEQGAKI